MTKTKANNATAKKTAKTPKTKEKPGIRKRARESRLKDPYLYDQHPVRRFDSLQAFQNDFALALTLRQLKSGNFISRTSKGDCNFLIPKTAEIEIYKAFAKAIGVSYKTLVKCRINSVFALIAYDRNGKVILLCPAAYGYDDIKKAVKKTCYSKKINYGNKD